jgi:hypothetical protein
MTKIQNKNESVLGCLELELGIYLGFVIWYLGFIADAFHC